MQSVSPVVSPVKSLEGEQSAVLAFYAGAQNARVGQILSRAQSKQLRMGRGAELITDENEFK